MYVAGTVVGDQKESPSGEGLIFYFFRFTIDFAFGVRRAILTAEKKIAAATPGVLFMIPAPC